MGGGRGCGRGPWWLGAHKLAVSRNQVTCLSVSADGSVLLSGSQDETVRLWDVQSKQCTRTMTLKGIGVGGWHLRPRGRWWR